MSEDNTATAEVNARSLRTAKISLKKGFEQFLNDFDPAKSQREKRKLNQRLYNGKNRRGLLYDENGIHLRTGEDLCDCLERICPGCHFPCPKCGSKKCGRDCRSNRKWAYESIAYEGLDDVVRNPHSKE